MDRGGWERVKKGKEGKEDREGEAVGEKRGRK